MSTESFDNNTTTTMFTSNQPMMSPEYYSPPLSWEVNMFHDEPTTTSNKKLHKRSISTFISKLYAMVGDPKTNQLISWNPSGTSFLVCNATLFAQEVLPIHFKHCNFSSFVRQLNMYGFHKINKSPRGQRGCNENEIWEFSHKKFQYGHPELLIDIKRKAMDSELLRRETGDIHTSFAMVQLSQADLLQQFHHLQENYSNLLSSFEEMKKTQLQQQIMLRQLLEQNNNNNNNNNNSNNTQRLQHPQQHSSSSASSQSSQSSIHSSPLTSPIDLSFSNNHSNNNLQTFSSSTTMNPMYTTTHMNPMYSNMNTIAIDPTTTTTSSEEDVFHFLPPSPAPSGGKSHSRHSSCESIREYHSYPTNNHPINYSM
ncbi:unnamed protein product [Cunninghamella blakesleeana]